MALSSALDGTEPIEPLTDEEHARLAWWHEVCGHNLPDAEQVERLSRNMDQAPRRRMTRTA